MNAKKFNWVREAEALFVSIDLQTRYFAGYEQRKSQKASKVIGALESLSDFLSKTDHTWRLFRSEKFFERRDVIEPCELKLRIAMLGSNRLEFILVCNTPDGKAGPPYLAGAGSRQMC